MRNTIVYGSVTYMGHEAFCIIARTGEEGVTSPDCAICARVAGPTTTPDMLNSWLPKTQYQLFPEP